MIIEISDRDASKVLEVFNEMNIALSIRTDEEATWIGDSVLEALFSLGEELYDSSGGEGALAYEMVKEMEWRLFKGIDSELVKLDRLRRDYFLSNVRDFIGINPE